MQNKPSTPLASGSSPSVAPFEIRSALLQSISLFGALEQDDLKTLASSLAEMRFKAGQTVFKQGDVGTEMFIIAQGKVNLHLSGENGDQISLRHLAAGDYFGEISVFDNKPRSAGATATSDAVLYSLSASALKAYLASSSQATMALLTTMSDRLRQTNAMLSKRAATNTVDEFEKNLNWSHRLADKVAALNGSWSFILLLILMTALWCWFNSPVFFQNPIDPYPYVFFNLLLAIIVALQGPLIVMSQNRQMMKDRATASADFKVNLKNEVNIESIIRDLSEFRKETNWRLKVLENPSKYEL